MAHPFPLPPIQPFERLNVFNGLSINAERWNCAHQYHRRHQSYHYQSINQPGIVRGLGVRAIPAPADSKAEDRDKRWIQVQPGYAIDLSGNLIVIPTTFDYHIISKVKSREPITIYLVAIYRDPDELNRDSTGETIQETYRLMETTETPTPYEVELCRILLQPDGDETISQAKDVFYPGYNQLDLRYRFQAQVRPQALVNLAQLSSSDPASNRSFLHFSYLLQAVEVLYPSLRASEEIGQVSLNDDSEHLGRYDLLYLTGKQKLTFSDRELTQLNDYINHGGVLLIEANSDSKDFIESVQQIAQRLKLSLKSLAKLRKNHPLRTRPFLFSALPKIQQQPLQFFIGGGGLILAIGELASLWGLDESLSTSRSTIRTGHELGINLLHYAWRRRQLTGLQQKDSIGQW